MKKYAVIVAGGSGNRFGSEIPKQFLLLNGKPILQHTIEKFFKTDVSIDIRLVLPENEIPRWNEFLASHPFNVPHSIIIGGKSRFESVFKGLQSILSDAIDNALVAIHDGVRPLIDPMIIERSFEVAREKGNAVVCMPAKDSMRMVNDSSNQALDRSALRIIQTPQTFQLSQLRKAFQQPESSLFTDDASVVEAAGFPIHLVEGSYLNIKITTPEDLKIAEALYF